jgi:hypothetical protein
LPRRFLIREEAARDFLSTALPGWMARAPIRDVTFFARRASNAMKI